MNFTFTNSKQKTAQQETASVKPKKPKFSILAGMGNAMGRAVKKAKYTISKSTGKKFNFPLEPPVPARPIKFKDLESLAGIIAEKLPQPTFHGITDYEYYDFNKAIKDIVDGTESYVSDGNVYFKIPGEKREKRLSEDDYLKFVSEIYGAYFEIYFRDSLPKNFYYLMRGSIEKKTRYNKLQLSTNDFLKIFHWKNSKTYFKHYSDEFLRFKQVMLYDNKKRWNLVLKN